LTSMVNLSAKVIILFKFVNNRDNHLFYRINLINHNTLNSHKK